MSETHTLYLDGTPEVPMIYIVYVAINGGDSSSSWSSTSFSTKEKAEKFKEEFETYIEKYIFLGCSNWEMEEECPFDDKFREIFGLLAPVDEILFDIAEVKYHG